ncbi:MAG: CapA family protein [Candidatus Kerfeldbacteria bacterium]|nr:CapA family protein [Candidatus Kerfeldbacteria bacterium]
MSGPPSSRRSSGAPSAAQRKFAHAAIDAGADLVVGHHPHVTQTTEEYQGGFIAYSLGNFIFDQFWSDETMRGQALEAVLPSSDKPTYTLRDLQINRQAQPTLRQPGTGA